MGTSDNRGVFLCTVFAALVVSSASYAGFYLAPKAGVAFNNDRNQAATVGIRSGYEFPLPIVQVGGGVAYTRLSDAFGNDGPTDIFDVSAYFGVPVFPLLDLLATAGVILNPSGSNYKGGVGIEAGLPFIDLIKIGASVIYFQLDSSESFVETSASVIVRL